jgi:hypothetical protein
VRFCVSSDWVCLGGLLPTYQLPQNCWVDRWNREFPYSTWYLCLQDIEKKRQIVTCKSIMTHSFLKDKLSGYQQSWILELLHFTRHPSVEHFFRALGGDGSTNICVLLEVRCWRWGSHIMPKNTNTWSTCVVIIFPPLLGPPSLQSDLWILYYSLKPGNKVVTTTGHQLSIQKTIIISTSYIYSWWN